jgi:flagellar FliJ protein
MKRFRFPLRPVAILRSHQEMRAREAFAAAVQALVAAEQALAEARVRLRDLEVQLTSRRAQHFSAQAEAQALAAYRRECAAEADAVKAMNDAHDAMQKRRTEYLEAHRKVEVLSRLEEKARAAHRYETMREEQAEFDDFAGRRFARRSLRSA